MPSIKDKLETLEKQNRLLVENIVDSIWVIDAGSLRYEYTAPTVGRLSGYTAQELVGRSIFEELTPESSKIAMERLWEEVHAYEQGKHASQSMELEAVDKNGRKYWVEIKAKLLEEPGSPLKIVGVTRDITARKKAELQLGEQNRKLVEALAEKERLLKEIKVLKKLLPICSGCKRIRDDDGKWWPLDAYIEAQTDSNLTHTVCPDCKDIFYPDLKK